VSDVQTTDYADLLEKAEGIWKNIVPDVPFDYSFLDESIARLYESEQTLSRIISAFTLMAILISCLGLFGLSVFAAEQRTKEIGIRKVLGASTTGILGLLSKDYIRLVLIALVIASPVAYFIMNRWLDEFAFRIPIEWWVFVVAGLAALGVTLLTISFQSIRAALSNPANSLRNE
jgi:putative ABC transport system permease protein